MTNHPTLKTPIYGRSMWHGHDENCEFWCDQYPWECTCHHGIWYWAW